MINKIKCKLSVNYKIQTKNDIGKYNDSFEERLFTIDDLGRHVRDGYSFTSLLNGSNRSSENFKSIQLLALDFDGTIPLQEFLSLQETKELVALIYTTLSHRQKGEDRFRAVFVLEKPITDSKKFKIFIKELMKIFSNLSDKNCSDPSRLWLGAKDCEVYTIDNIVTESFIEERLRMGKEEEYLLKESKKISNTLKSPISYKQVEELLQIIPKEPGYQIWRNLIWSIASCFSPEETFRLINNWSPDNLNGEVIKELIKRFKDEFSIATLVYYAKEYSDSKQVNQILKDSKSNNHCTLVLEECFNNGEGYISDGQSLYLFENGYYKKINEGNIRKKIADFFDKNSSFRVPKYINEAFQWLMVKTYISPEKYNKTGLNLNNGFLEVKYSEEKPFFNFIPSSKDSYHVYKSSVDYNPEISSKIAAKYVYEMFENTEQADIFLKNLASIFDRNILRVKYGRQLKALFLYGPGSNGKDTLKEWAYLLLGGRGMTSIPLHDFKLADKKSNLLAPLLTSKINWASESNKIALDRCACLKTIVTGDSMAIDIKYHDSINLNADIPLIFNFNEEPALSVLNQASSTRFCLLKLPYIFCSNPNSMKNEKLGDYRFKNDKVFLEKTILPSFLNLLMEKFISFYESGIDYTELDLELLQMAKDSNHLYDFIEDLEIKECTLEYGMTATELFNDYYKPYLIENGLVTDTSYSLIFHDCEFDKFAKNPKQLSKMLSKVFYGLRRDKVNSKRYIGLNIASKLPPSLS